MKRVLFTSVSLIPLMSVAYAAEPSATVVVAPDPFMDAVVTVGVTILSTIAGFAYKYAKTHWAILNDARVNEALASFASRLAASILTNVVQQTINPSATAIPLRQVTVTHPDVINGADKMLAKYPKFTAHVGMGVDGAREMIVQEYDKLKAPAHVAILNALAPPLPTVTAGGL